MHIYEYNYLLNDLIGVILHRWWYPSQNPQSANKKPSPRCGLLWWSDFVNLIQIESLGNRELQLRHCLCLNLWACLYVGLMVGMGGSSLLWVMPPRAISTCRNSQLVKVKRMRVSGEPDTKGTSMLPSPQGSQIIKESGQKVWARVQGRPCAFWTWQNYHSHSKCHGKCHSMYKIKQANIGLRYISTTLTKHHGQNNL